MAKSAHGIITAFRRPTSERKVFATVLEAGKSHQQSVAFEPELLELFVDEGTAGSKVTKKEYDTKMRAAIKKLEISKKASTIFKGGKEYIKPASAMKSQLVKAAQRISRSLICGGPIMVRFHGDGDGAAAAVALFRGFEAIAKLGAIGGMNVSWSPCKDIAYRSEAYHSDALFFSSYSSVERPLLIICDFGSTLDSNDGLSRACEAFDIVWIDHHLIPKGLHVGKSCNYINPFNHGSDSRLSAGLIASLIARMLGGDCERIGEAALVSDHSACANYLDKQAVTMAFVIDYLATRKGHEEGTPKSIDAIISDNDRLQETGARVAGMLDEMLSSGFGHIKRYKSHQGNTICVIDFKKVEQQEYPPPGRFSSEMQHRLEQVNGGKTITIVHYGNYMSVRVSKDISQKLGLIDAIERMRAHSDGVISGGGHKEAASIRCGEFGTSQTLRLLLGELGVTV